MNVTPNVLFTGDNLHFMNAMDSEFVDLIYLDPPFNSKRVYSAPIGSESAGAEFKDIWTWQDVDVECCKALFAQYPDMVRFIDNIKRMHSAAMASYTLFMAQRILEMHRILKSTGTLYLHVDPTASHYLKVILDRVFGKNNYRNEIVWYYEKWTASAKSFQKNHDVIFRYTKTDNYTFNTEYLVTKNLEEKYKKGYLIGGGYGPKGLVVYDDSLPKVQEMIQSGKYQVHYANKRGKPLSDVFSIPIINPAAKERTGFPTQKPLALLYRIIKVSSNKGDIVFDPFCGCATTMVAAQQLDRKWIGIDIEAKAAELVMRRLQDDSGLFTDFVNTKRFPVRTDIEIQAIEPKTKSEMKRKLYAEQGNRCNLCLQQHDIKLCDIDHIIPRAKGGQDTYSNYQVLCRDCNGRKGTKSMEQIMSEIAKETETLLKVRF